MFTAPRPLTFIASVVLAVLAVASLRWHIPTVGQFVVGHRLAMLVAAYAILAIGVVVQGL